MQGDLWYFTPNAIALWEYTIMHVTIFDPYHVNIILGAVFYIPLIVLDTLN